MIPGITDVERAVTVVTSLMTLGTAPEELEIHSHTALNLGLTPEKLVGITYNLVSYIGFPRVIGALRTVAKVLKERDLLDKMQATLPKL